MDNCMPVCEYCGSNEVVFDAFVKYNAETKEYHIESILDSGVCQNCHEEF